MIRIRTLGESTITVGTREISPKARAQFQLLLYLGIERGKRTSRASLAALVWGDTDLEKANHSLRQTLYELRRVGVRLLGDGAHVELASDDVDIDLAELERDGTEAIKAALAGDFLPAISGQAESYSEWLDAVRERVNARRRRVLLDELFRSREAGHIDRLEQIARELRRIDPLNEEANCALAEVLAARGSKSAALSTLESYVRDLGEDKRSIRLPALLLRERISREARSESVPNMTVGRDETLALIRAAIERMISDRAGTRLWLWGEAGIGKTHVVKQVAHESVVRGLSTIITTCVDRPDRRPLGAIAELVPQLIRAPGALGCDPEALALLQRLTSGPGSLGNYPGTEADARDAISSALAELLDAVAAEQPLLVVVDDVQWIDSASMSAIWHSARKLDARPCAFLFGSRAKPPVDLSLDLRPIEAVLQPLGADASRTLARHLLPAAHRDSTAIEWISRVSGGHPLFIVELSREVTRGNIGHIPESLQDLLRSKLRVLSSDAENILVAIVILAKHASIRRVERLLEMNPSHLWNGLKELTAAGLILEDGTAIRPRHDLLSDAVLTVTDPAILRYGHHRAAKILEEELRAGSESVEIVWDSAQHWRSAGQSALAEPLIHDCIQHLLTIGLFDDAARLLQAFLSDAPAGGHRASLLYEMGVLEMSRGQTQRALAAFQQARVESVRPPEPGSDIAILIIDAEWRQAIITSREAVGAWRSCVAATGASIASRLRAATNMLILADYLCDDRLDAEAFDIVTQLRRQAIDPKSRSELLRAQTLHEFFVGNIDHALEYVMQLVAEARALRSSLALSKALTWCAQVSRRAGLVDLSRTQLLEAIQLTDARYSPDICAHSRVALALLELYHGDLHRAASLVDEVEAALNDPSSAASPVREDDMVLRAKIELEMGNADKVAGTIAQIDMRVYRARAPKAAIQAVAVSARAKVHLGLPVDDAAFDELLMMHLAHRHRSFQDYVALVVYELLVARNRNVEASRLLREYFEAYRIDRYPPIMPLQRVVDCSAFTRRRTSEVAASVSVSENSRNSGHPTSGRKRISS